MTPAEQAKVLLPDMPDAVFDIWLGPLIEKGGWPFTSVRQSTVNTDWHQCLAGVSLQDLSTMRWLRCNAPFSLPALHPSSAVTILGICAAYVEGWPSTIPGMTQHQVGMLIRRLRALKDGRARESFFRSREYLERIGSLHTPVVLIQRPDGLKIMDGNHRAAALLSLLDSHFVPLDSWIGN